MMNIVLITDENYVTPTGTTIASVLHSNPGEKFTFYIVTRHLSDDYIAELESFIGPNNELASLKVITIDEKDLIDFPLRSGDHVSVATYYRIYFPKILPQNENKVLFLDGDILCVDSIKDFYETDLTEYSCAATHDERNDDPENFVRLKYSKKNGYFCAGVMLINLEWWRQNDVMKKCLDYIAGEPEACLWHDQDALNHVLNGTVVWADFRYNFMQGYFFDKKAMMLDSKYFSKIDEARQNPCILHFSSAYKPWHYECNHPLKNQYRAFFKEKTGYNLKITYRLHGIRHIAWLAKKVLTFFRIRRYADFRKPLVTEQKRYQFFESCPNQKIAGSKAPQDVCLFAERLGFKPLYFFHWGERTIFHRITGQIRRFFEYFFFFLRIKRNSILLLQFPYIRGGVYWRHFFLSAIKKYKSVKIITIIHDINELRYEHAEKEAEFLTQAISFSDLLITHNDRMSNYLVDVRGVSEKKLIPLGLFDYYFSKPACEKNIEFEQALSIAGNLDENKCIYIRYLSELKGIDFYLYGANFNSKDTNQNIIYKGVFDPNDIVQELKHGFGLVWDGCSIDGCEGLYGHYLKFNNPHKLSMYLSAGLPVVVWEKSALSEFVVNNKLGFAVSSLSDAIRRIKSTTAAEYMEMHKTCLKVSDRLREGYFLKSALVKCLMTFQKS